MTAADATRIVVLGLGNVIQSDDGLGVRAIERLLADDRLPPEVELVDGGTLGLELLSCAAGATHLLILDAVDIDAQPGSLLRVEGEDLRGLPGSASVHQLGVADLLAALRMMDQEPQNITLLGVQPGSTSLGTELSPEVEAALDELVGMAQAEIASWTELEVGARHA